MMGDTPVCQHGVQRFLLCHQCAEDERCECDEGECSHCERRREAQIAQVISDELGLTQRAFEGAERAAKAALKVMQTPKGGRMTTDPSSDVLERLRRKARGPVGTGLTKFLVNPDGPEAAATIERLSAERMQLRDAVELFTGQAVFDPHTHRASVDEFVVSQARAALRNTAENG